MSLRMGHGGGTIGLNPFAAFGGRSEAPERKNGFKRPSQARARRKPTYNFLGCFRNPDLIRELLK